MKILKYFLLSMALGFSHIGETQILPSPDATAMAQGINTPVNLSSGVASVSVSLYNVQANNGAQIPVSLEYNTSPIKVKQVASSVGLGWRLVAGGAITRVVKGQPDLETAAVDLSSQSGFGLYKDLVKRDKDGEKDIFYFSYPGNSGRFFMYDGNPRTPDRPDQSPFIPLPWQEIKIEGGLGGWEITDPYGNKYLFGNSVASREISRTNSSDENGVYDPAEEKVYISTWYLTEIIYLNQPAAKSIKFEYTGGANFTDESVLTVGDFITGCHVSEEVFGNYYFTPYTTLSTLSPESVKRFKTNVTNQNRYLKKIIFPKGELLFEYEFNRLDGIGLGRLKSVNLMDTESKIIDGYSFNTGYFDANDSYFKESTYQSVNGFCNDAKCKRLKLNSIDRIVNGHSIKIRSFEYTNNKVFSEEYGHDLYELPPRDSYYVDHFGGFTGGVVSGKYSPFPYLDLSFENDDSKLYKVKLGHIDRSVRLSAKANLLSKIYTEAGGFNEINYKVQNGTLVVESIKSYVSEEVPVAEKSFEYFQPSNYTASSYHTVEAEYNDECTYFLNDESRTEEFTFHILRVYSNSLSDLFDLNGSNRIFGKVRERNLVTGGYIDHEFIGFNEREEQAGIKGSFRINYDNDTNVLIKELESSDPPFGNNDLSYFDLGVEYKTSTYDASGNLLNDVIQEVVKDSEIQYVQKNIAISDKRKVTNKKTDYIKVEYNIYSRPVWVTKTTSNSYEDGKSLTSNQNIIYHDKYRSVPFQTITVDPSETETRTTIRYPDDILNSSILNNPTAVLATLKQMKELHAILLPIETISEIKPNGNGDFKVLGASYVTYKSQYSNSFIVPYQSFWLKSENLISDFQLALLEENDIKIDGRYGEAIGTIEAYDSNGNVTSTRGGNGLTITNSYDILGNYLLSTSTYDFKTTYVHLPLVGISKVIDPNNKTTKYEYDHYNRLKLIRDHNDNIIERYRYNSIGEDNNLSSDFYVSAHTQDGITLAAPVFYGQTLYSWDFGDGTKLNTNEPTITHSFSGKTSSNVSLTLTNPEYEASNLSSKTNKVYVSGLTITDAKQVDLCENASTVQFAISGADECGSLLANWYYKIGSGNWIQIDTGSIEYDGRVLNFYNFSKTNPQQIAIKCEIKACQGCLIQNGTELQSSMITGFSNINCMQDTPY